MHLGDKNNCLRTQKVIKQLLQLKLTLNYYLNSILKKDIDYDWNCLGHFAHFFISLHNFLNSSLQTNNIITNHKLQEPLNNIIFCPPLALIVIFHLRLETLHCIFFSLMAWWIFDHSNTVYRIKLDHFAIPVSYFSRIFEVIEGRHSLATSFIYESDRTSNRARHIQYPKSMYI